MKTLLSGLLAVVLFGAQAGAQQNPELVSIDESVKAEAAIKSLVAQMQQALEQDKTLTPEQKKNMADKLKGSEDASAELKSLVYQVVRQFNGDLVMGAVTAGFGGTGSYRFPFLKGLGSGIEGSAGLALVMRRNSETGLRLPQITGYLSGGPEVSAGQPNDGKGPRAKKVEITLVFRVFFVPANAPGVVNDLVSKNFREKVSSVSADDKPRVHAGNLGGVYVGVGAEVPWRLLLSGNFETNVYGSWGLNQPGTLLQKAVPEVLMFSVNTALSRGTHGLNAQGDVQYVRFVSLELQ